MSCSLKGHTGEVFSINYFPDDNQIISLAKDNTAIVWDLKNKKISATYGSAQGNQCEPQWMQTPKFNPSEDGRFLNIYSSIILSEIDNPVIHNQRKALFSLDKWSVPGTYTSSILPGNNFSIVLNNSSSGIYRIDDFSKCIISIDDMISDKYDALNAIVAGEYLYISCDHDSPGSGSLLPGGYDPDHDLEAGIAIWKIK
jgi:WD40 repeat protein